jgi:16S rRNA (cytosine967-C5)-methyltransferase
VTASSEGTTKSVRQLASEILLKVDTKRAYADVLLDNTLKSSALGERDRALLTEITYGTLRWRGRIDAHLNRHLHRPLIELDPFLKNLFRITLYQLLFLNRIPPYAAVHEAVELAKIRGGASQARFVNGVLRNVLRSNGKSSTSGLLDGSLSVMSDTGSHPEWLARRWIAQFGRENAAALMRANNDKPPLALRVNLRRTSREALLDRLRHSGVSAESTPRSPQGIVITSGGALDRIAPFNEGLIQAQSEASQLVTFVLAPQPGEHILDACAAPGGKATHILEMMADSGELVATDVSAKGIKKIRENFARLQLKSVRFVRADMTRDLPQRYRFLYDRILVDAPCSGFGTLRSHPEIKWQRDENDIRRLSQLQATILSRAAPLLKPGGILVYSTCTLIREENEDVVQNFLLANRQFELGNAADYLPPVAKSMVQDNYFLALPHRDNTDGFFAARMRKVA